MSRKIFINGYFGYYNLGDDLLLEEFTKIHLSNEEIYVLVKEPYYQLKVKWINRYHLFQLFFLIQQGDVLINLGGIFQDKTSWFSFYYYFLVNLIFFLKRASIFFINTDFLDVRSSFHKALVFFLLKKSKLIILRNKKEYAQYEKILKNVFYAPDIVYLTKFSFKRIKEKYTLVVLREYVHLKKLLNELKQSNKNLKFLIMNKEKRLLKILLQYFTMENIYVYHYKNKANVLNLIYNAEKIITMRYHVGILGLMLHKEISIIDVNNKLRSLVEDYRWMKKSKKMCNRLQGSGIRGFGVSSAERSG